MEFQRLTAALDGNAALQRRARLAALSFTVASGGEASVVRVGERITVAKGHHSLDAAFSLTASPETWAEFAKAMPAVGYQSLVGMQRVGHLKVDGDVLVWGNEKVLSSAVEQVGVATQRFTITVEK